MQGSNLRHYPPVPSRMSGTYSSNYNTYSSNSNTPSLGIARRAGTSSASNSPPGTPPNGLRNYYLNAAMHRSAQHPHPLYGYSNPSSTTNLARPSISILVPPNGKGSLTPGSSLARRSYSADHLAVNTNNMNNSNNYDLEITVTTPGGSNSNEEHATNLERALSKLIEHELKEGQTQEHDNGDYDSDDNQNGGPILIKPKNHRNGKDRRDSRPGPKTSESAPETLSSATARKHGILLTPSVVANRNEQGEDPEKGTDAAQDQQEHEAEKEKYRRKESDRNKDKDKEKKKSMNRLSKLFQNGQTKESKAALMGQQHHPGSSRRPVQPATGVLSNLLKLHAGTRQPKQHHASSSTPKPPKEKKKRPVLYSRSANNSTTSVSRSVFGTYPPLPNTITQASATGMTPQNTTTHRNHNNINSGRQSIQFDGSFGAGVSAAIASFAQGHSPIHSPIHSPNGSPRGSFSFDNYTPPSGSVTGMLSAEDQLRITFAVADILQRQDYVLRLARAMIKYGAPSHRLEDAVDHTAHTLELNLQCVYLPNLMIVAFTDYETHTSETHLLKVSAGLNMSKFAQVHQVLKMVTHSSIPVEEAIMKLDAINMEKDMWPRWANILSYAVASFCTASMFFRGNWTDSGVALLLGTMVGLMNWLSEMVPSYSHICEVTMSVLVSFIAQALHRHVCQSAVKMAGIVMLLPGYTITCAILELSSRHMISGSVRLFYAVIFSLLLGYGLTIGASLWALFDRSSTESKVTVGCLETLDAKWNILFVPLFAFSLNIWLKAHPRQWVLATVLSIVGYSISYSTSTFAGARTEVSSALASFAIGLIGNVYQRLTRQLTFQAVVCAVFFLVPGSMGLKGAMALFTEDMAGGFNFALQMVIAAIAISVGLFASALVVYPMGKARSAQMTF
ncbi:hypothetical protein BGW38_000823 [Lunasporangiospora selenospora]|uniref:Threonine/serine exporter-like N-terminal domain-containing protein n=1 Tax=Lunasporangiospora selenospora TaxID=979761 RepID=A0A9P6FWI2_9FUNG|nr:hypothetical protein BGW38_000823 [Lunasporangiospora selenospora]